MIPSSTGRLQSIVNFRDTFFLRTSTGLALFCPAVAFSDFGFLFAGFFFAGAGLPGAVVAAGFAAAGFVGAGFVAAGAAFV